jgi:hypothetical protein
VHWLLHNASDEKALGVPLQGAVVGELEVLQPMFTVEPLDYAGLKGHFENILSAYKQGNLTFRPFIPPQVRLASM